MKKFLPIIFLLIFFSSQFFSLTYGQCEPPECPTDHPEYDVNNWGYESTGTPEDQNYIYWSHETDPDSPNFSTINPDNSNPNITSLYNFYAWNWTDQIREGPYPAPSDAPPGAVWTTFVGFETSPGSDILVPASGYDIGEGQEVMVLYATPTSVTLKYTREDSIVCGYTLYLDGINVNPTLVDYYNQLDAAGRSRLPALSAGEIIGTATTELRIAVADTGTFGNPRVSNDYWHGSGPVTGTPLSLESISVYPGHGDCFKYKEGDPITTDFHISVIQPGGETTEELPPGEYQEGGGTTTETGEQGFTGYLSLVNSFLPDFSGAERRWKSAIPRLLPPNFARSLNPPTHPLKTWVRHYVFGEQMSTEIPWGEITLPSYWTGVIGLSDILRRLFLGTLSLANMAPKVIQPSRESVFASLNPNIPNQGSSLVHSQPNPGNEARSELFSVIAFIRRIINFVIDLVLGPTGEPDTWQQTTDVTIEADFLNKTRSNLIEGRRFTRQTEFLKLFLPPGLVKSNPPMASKGEFDIHNGEFILGSGSEKLNYQNQKMNQALYCLHVASLYPPEKDISKIDPLCHSRNPKDYKGKTGPIPEPDDTHELCQWDESIGGCHYYQLGLGNQYSCEGGLCNPLGLPSPGKFVCGDANNPQGNCDASCIYKCHIATKEEMEGCYYISLPVCVRNDGVGGCAGICNWACCGR